MKTRKEPDCSFRDFSNRFNTLFSFLTAPWTLGRCPVKINPFDANPRFLGFVADKFIQRESGSSGDHTSVSLLRRFFDIYAQKRWLRESCSSNARFFRGRSSVGFKVNLKIFNCEEYYLLCSLAGIKMLNVVIGLSFKLICQLCALIIRLTIERPSPPFPSLVVNPR
jgi:hypothetical protein